MVENEYKSWKKNVKLLEKCRLDMDAAASALKSTPTDKKTEKTESTNERYNEVLQEVEQQLEQLPTAHQLLVDRVRIFLRIVHDYCKSAEKDIGVCLG